MGGERGNLLKNYKSGKALKWNFTHRPVNNEILTKNREALKKKSFFQCFLYFFVASILRGMKKAKGI